MRTLLFITATAFALTTAAQESVTGPYERVEVVNVDSTMSAAQLYGRAKHWFADSFRDSKEVIQLDDPANAAVVGRASFPYVATVMNGRDARHGNVRYNIEVACKDGRYRVRMYNFVHEATPFYNDFLKIMVSNDIGALRSGYPCSTTYGLGIKEKKREAHIREVCTQEVEPQLRINEARVIASLRSAMVKPADGSDW